MAEELYEDLEAMVPYYRLLEEGATVTLVGPEAKAYESKRLSGQSGRCGKRCERSGFGAVVVPGGFAPDRLRRYPAVLDLVPGVSGKERRHRGYLPCGVGANLGPCGKGQARTCVAAIKDDLINAGTDMWTKRS